VGAEEVHEVQESVRARPSAALRPYVDWYSGYRLEGGAPGTHRGLPSPQLTLIFTLEWPLEIAAHPDPGQPSGSFDALVGGLHTRPALVMHPGRQAGVQIALNPLGARALLGVPAGELAARDLSAGDVLGDAFVDRLRTRMLEAAGWPGRLRVLETQLLTRLAATPPEDVLRPEVLHVWRSLLAQRGTADLGALAASVGWSERHLRSRFHAEFGVGPKTFARLVRFSAVRRALPARLRAGDTIAALAAGYGYYDQAHLAAEFRAFAGCPPTTWLAEEFRILQAPGAGARRESGA
jgi:AraC-like DNA-binding protein